MARQTLILAKSITEANSYAKLAGLQRFTYRSVRSAGAIRGVRDAEVHILPSFTVRLDRHAILAALTWAKSLEVFYVDPADLAPAEEDSDSNVLEAGTPPTEAEIDEAYALNAAREEPLVAVVTDGKHQTRESLTRAVEAEIAADLQVPDRPKARKPRTPKPVASAAPAADDFF